MFSFFLNKYIVSAIGSLLISVAMYAATSYYETKGYNRAINEIRAATNEKLVKAAQEAFDKAEIKIKKAAISQRKLYENSLKQVVAKQKVKLVTEYVIKEVNKIVYVKGECSDLGTKYVELRNKAINSANTATINRP